MLKRETLLQARDRAVEILEENKYEVSLNKTQYRRTVPSKKFYVHQWKWDSATHAMGLIHVDPERAYDELRSLFAGQWENGMIPHMIFNPEETKYFPSSDVWGTGKHANGEIITSGITQPPLITKSILYLYEQDPDRERATAFVTEVIDKLVADHDYFKNFRDPHDIGLLTIVHPWETGTDNSPRFDDAMERIDLAEIPDRVKELSLRRTDIKVGKAAHRPTPQDYYRYLHLVDLFQQWDWDYNRIVEESPFAIQDVLFNSLWFEANRSMAMICEAVGLEDEAEKYTKWADQTREALLSLWSPEFNQFVDVDVANGRSEVIREDTNSTFLPLFIPDLPVPILEGLLGKLNNPDEYATPFPVPTTAMNSPKFDLMRYWRGPTWPITNLFIIEGLGRQDHPKARKIQQNLIHKTLEVIATQGFYEYYDPTLTQFQLSNKDKDEKALGFGSFSWTAAIYLYLYHNYMLK
jgi:glycogen debranching enzyme